MISAEDIFNKLADFHFPPLGECSHKVQSNRWDYRSPLMEALENNNVTEAQALLRNKKTCLLCRDSAGNTAFHYAARLGDLVVLRLLLQKGAEKGAKNTCGQTALFAAAERANHAACHLLMKCGFDPNARDNSKQTPIFSIDKGNEPEKVLLTLKTLVDGGAQIELYDTLGNTPLAHHISSTTLVKGLLDRGANMLAFKSDGETALQKSIVYGERATAFLLIDRGAAKSDTGALEKAVVSGEVDIARKILEKGVDAHALRSAAYKLVDSTPTNQVAMASLLKEHGARIFGTFTDNELDHNIEDTLKAKLILGKECSDTGALTLILDKVSLELFTLACENGPNLEVCGQTLLNNAAYHGRVDILKYLLEKGVSLRDDHGQIPALISAVRSRAGNSVELLTVLVDAGAEFSQIPQGYDNELIEALKCSKTAVARWILEQCKKKKTEVLEHAGKKGLRPIDYAIGTKSREQIALLVHHGACLDNPCRLVKSLQPVTARQVIKQVFPEIKLMNPM